jgi:hypothetical protein
MYQDKHRPARRVTVGTNAAGSSTVVSDSTSPSTQLPNGIVLDEVWQQRSLPARTEDRPLPEWTLGPAAPVEGVVVRILTMPAAGSDSPGVPDLHSDPSLHIITMLDGELDVVLQDGRVSLNAGDTIVLRDSMHDLVNLHSRPSRFVYTSVPLRGGPSDPGERGPVVR